MSREAFDPEEKSDEAAKSIAEIVAKHSLSGQPSPYETLEQHAERVKSQVYSDLEEFKARLKRGLTLLLKEGQSP